jgi:hypothetical protein
MALANLFNTDPAYRRFDKRKRSKILAARTSTSTSNILADLWTTIKAVYVATLPKLKLKNKMIKMQFKYFFMHFGSDYNHV